MKFERKKLYEDNEFNEYDRDLYSNYYELNKNTYARKTIDYEGDSAYNDDSGAKWRYVKNCDYDTIALAVIDGMCDHGILPIDTYRNIKSKEDLDNITMNNKIARRLINKVYSYLYPFMHKGRFKVYRGFNILARDYEKLSKSDRMNAKLIKRFSNTMKAYNSYTLDPYVADSFATGNALGTRRPKEDTYAIIVAAIADRSDISFAYTAYLIGKHGNLNENELNINCIKELSYQKIETIRKLKYINGQYIEQ